MEDLLIRGGQVIDGNGTPSRRADVAIRNGRITAVGDCQDREAQREIDSSGQIVAPKVSSTATPTPTSPWL